MKGIIYIGHGEPVKGSGYDPGAVNSNLKLEEFQIAKGIGMGAFEFLKNYDLDIAIYNLDAKMNLNERIVHANKSGADFIIEIHLNAYTGTAYGTEAWYYPGTPKGRILADAICKEVSKTLGIPQRSNGVDDGGDKSGTQFGIVTKTRPVAVLVETCFITTNSEAQKVDTLPEQKAAGAAIGLGVVKAYGLKERIPVKPSYYSVIVEHFGSEEDAKAAGAKIKESFGYYNYVVKSTNK